MVNKEAKRLRRFCKEYWKIENYEQAVNDKENLWICHHRLELTLDNELVHTPKELKRMGMYYNRPYFELIFLKKKDHDVLHKKGKPIKPIGDFGKKFFKHFGYTQIKNPKLYDREKHWYYSHNKVCRWEVEK